MSENKPPEEVPNADVPAEEAPASGSRWEDTEAVPPAVEPEPAPAAAPTPAGVDRSRWLNGKTALIGAGLGVALVAGLGGFAIGQATADGHDHGRFESERGWPGGGRDDHPRPPGDGGLGFDRRERPDFGQPIDPDQDGDPGSSDSDQDDSSTQG